MELSFAGMSLCLFESPHLGSEDEVMGKHRNPCRQYSAEEKETSVGLLGTLRAEFVADGEPFNEKPPSWFEALSR